MGSDANSRDGMAADDNKSGNTLALSIVCTAQR